MSRIMQLNGEERLMFPIMLRLRCLLRRRSKKKMMITLLCFQGLMHQPRTHYQILWVKKHFFKHFFCMYLMTISISFFPDGQVIHTRIRDFPAHLMLREEGVYKHINGSWFYFETWEFRIFRFLSPRPDWLGKFKTQISKLKTLMKILSQTITNLPLSKFGCLIAEYKR